MPPAMSASRSTRGPGTTRPISTTARLQSDDEPEYGTAEDIDGDRQVGATDRLPLVLVDDHHIDDGVVDLDLIENPRNCRWIVAGGLTWAGGIGSSA